MTLSLPSKFEQNSRLLSWVTQILAPIAVCQHQSSPVTGLFFEVWKQSRQLHVRQGISRSLNEEGKRMKKSTRRLLWQGKQTLANLGFMQSIWESGFSSTGRRLSSCNSYKCQGWQWEITDDSTVRAFGSVVSTPSCLFFKSWKTVFTKRPDLQLGMLREARSQHRRSRFR